MDKENKQLICNNITIAYERVNIFEDVSMTVCEGDYISIVGENGTGKSTMIKGILGLVPLKKGTIEYGDGISKKNIGYLPQQTAMKKDFPASVKEVILSGSLSTSKFSVFYSSEAKKKVKKVMERLSITNLANKTFGDLSGGQKQRVLLARALMATDKILFLDEPIAGLDPIVTAEFYEIIKDLNIKNNLTIIMVSHDLENAMKYSNKILHMDENNYFFGTREEYLNSKLARGFLAN